MTNEKLSEMVEKAGEGSRELDASIWLAIYRPDYKFPDKVLNRTPFDKQEAVGRFTHDGMGGGSSAARYTTSLDAARTLVPTKPYPDLRPGEWWWMMEVRKYEVRAFIAYENHDAGIPEFEAIAATPALALCAAALKARGL